MKTEQAQNMTALAKANQIRMANAELKRRIETMPEAEARAEVATIIEQPSDTAGALPVGRLIAMIRRFGYRRTSIMLRRAGVASADRRVRDLTARQRSALAEVLRDPRTAQPSSGLPPIGDAA